MKKDDIAGCAIICFLFLLIIINQIALIRFRKKLKVGDKVSVYNSFLRGYETGTITNFLQEGKIVRVEFKSLHGTASIPIERQRLCFPEY